VSSALVSAWDYSASASLRYVTNPTDGQINRPINSPIKRKRKLWLKFSDYVYFLVLSFRGKREVPMTKKKKSPKKKKSTLKPPTNLKVTPKVRP